ncbi:hypothetical protein EBR21_13535, partial [bacterium]|nr:hypothetical protein [bacterium]
MFDQATTLRRLMEEARVPNQPGATSSHLIEANHISSKKHRKAPRVITVTGGKGGVGKTLTTA